MKSGSLSAKERELLKSADRIPFWLSSPVDCNTVQD